MRNSRDGDDRLLVIDGVNDPVVTLPEPVGVDHARELHGCGGPWVTGELPDALGDALLVREGKAAHGPKDARLDLDTVLGHT